MVFALLLLLVLFGLGARGWKKTRTGVVFLALGFFFVFAVGGGVVPRLLLEGLQTHDYLAAPEWKARNVIVVLGGGIRQWGTDGPWSSGVFAQSRVREGARLHRGCRRRQRVCQVLVSGGAVSKGSVSEAEVLARELRELGVSDADLVQEASSRNTFQNAEFSSVLLAALKPEQVLLVTSGLHLRRALQYFAHFHVLATPAPADRMGAIGSFLPLAYNFALTDMALHEYLGIARLQVYNGLGWNRGGGVR